MRLGEFDSLAQYYDESRPNYSNLALEFIMQNIDAEPNDINLADIGAGTGVWTRLVSSLSLGSIVAVEPSTEMISYGNKKPGILTNISWRIGKAEETGLNSDYFDVVTMASSLHYANFSIAVKEIQRILKKRGLFVALWHPRIIEKGSIFDEIENQINKLNPSIKRISSGYSEFANSLKYKLESTNMFDHVMFQEFPCVELMTKERYLNAWRSANDVQVQLGMRDFEKFMAYLNNRLSDIETLHPKYMTRVWLARVIK